MPLWSYWRIEKEGSDQDPGNSHPGTGSALQQCTFSYTALHNNTFYAIDLLASPSNSFDRRDASLCVELILDLWQIKQNQTDMSSSSSSSGEESEAEEYYSADEDIGTATIAQNLEQQSLTNNNIQSPNQQRSPQTTNNTSQSHVNNHRPTPKYPLPPIPTSTTSPNINTNNNNSNNKSPNETPEAEQTTMLLQYPSGVITMESEFEVEFIVKNLDTGESFSSKLIDEYIPKVKPIQNKEPINGRWWTHLSKYFLIPFGYYH